jgi:hypothetical protein
MNEKQELEAQIKTCKKELKEKTLQFTYFEGNNMQIDLIVFRFFLIVFLIIKIENEIKQFKTEIEKCQEENKALLAEIKAIKFENKLIFNNEQQELESQIKTCKKELQDNNKQCMLSKGLCF